MSAKVLILEPDILQRDLMVMALTRHQLSPLACSDPADAFSLIKEHHPNLLIINLLLRGQNGLDFLAELRKDHLIKNCKILVISPLGFSEIVLRAAKAGAAAFLIKPVDPEQLAMKVLNLLGTQETVNLFM